MKRFLVFFVALLMGIAIVELWSLADLTAQTSAALNRFGRVADFRLPTPYLRSTRMTAATTYPNIKSTTGVVGCVNIGVAGASGSRVTLYNAHSGPTVNAELAVVDGAVAGQICYGMIFSEALTVVVSSGGAVPDVVVTWR